MGIGPFSRLSVSSLDNDYGGGLFSSKYKHEEVRLPAGNPIPTRFKVKRVKQVGAYLVAEIHYPDCRNYEGKKILIFHGVDESTLRSWTFIDPHFAENKRYPSPIARFEPTSRGWNNALTFCKHA